MSRAVHYQRGVPFSLTAEGACYPAPWPSSPRPPKRPAPAAPSSARARAPNDSPPAPRATAAVAPADDLAVLRAEAQAGRGEALHLLGLAHFLGQGTPRDPVEARRLQREAARRGVVDAQFELSLLLALGLGGAVDARGARRWEEKAAEAGHPRACLNRGARLARARRPQLAEAVRWYARAADGGNAEAAARLCRMSLLGQGLPRDERTARRWYQRAIELGYDWSATTRA